MGNKFGGLLSNLKEPYWKFNELVTKNVLIDSNPGAIATFIEVLNSETLEILEHSGLTIFTLRNAILCSHYHLDLHGSEKFEFCFEFPNKFLIGDYIYFDYHPEVEKRITIIHDEMGFSKLLNEYEIGLLLNGVDDEFDDNEEENEDPEQSLVNLFNEVFEDLYWKIIEEGNQRGRLDEQQLRNVIKILMNREGGQK